MVILEIHGDRDKDTNMFLVDNGHIGENPTILNKTNYILTKFLTANIKRKIVI